MTKLKKKYPTPKYRYRQPSGKWGPWGSLNVVAHVVKRSDKREHWARRP